MDGSSADQVHLFMMIPSAIIQVGENMMGIQGHPEFSASFNEELIKVNARHLKEGQEE